MASEEIDILDISRGAVTAPAGCGKTQLIANALTRHGSPKPILVLTHTNAGVVALRNRLDKAGVPARAYRLSTIDGWALRLVSLFPARSQLDPDLLKMANPGADYPAIRDAASRLLEGGHIGDVLEANYDRLIVDEYQDCSARQHAIAFHASKALRTCVLGDPMQAIFGFGGDALAHWENDVCRHFPIVAELKTPWRWINAGAEPLGRWLLDVRVRLLARQPIDLAAAPAGVSWVKLDGTQEDHKRQLQAGRVQPPTNDGHVLIIGESTKPDSQRLFASQTPGAITVEAVDLRDLVQFAARFDLTSADAFVRLTDFAQSVMTNIGVPDLQRRVRSILDGTARKPASDVETAAVAFVRSPTYRLAADLLVEMGKEGGVRAHRPAILRACLKALQLCGDDVTFGEAAIRMREQNRLLGRPLPRRAVGSTLLLKGLEADVVVVLNAHTLNARNLYVAMTRGSKRVLICSTSQVLNPKN